MPEGFSLEHFMQMLHDTENLVYQLEQIPDEQAADFVQSQVDNLSRVNLSGIRSNLPGYLEQYEEFRDGSVNNFAVIISTETDGYVQDIFSYSSRALEMLETRFYKSGAYVGDQLTSMKEHEKWYEEFRELLINSLNSAIKTYTNVLDRLEELSRDSLFGKTVRKNLDKYGIDIGELPTTETLVRAGKKVLSIYDTYERREMTRYG